MRRTLTTLGLIVLTVCFGNLAAVFGQQPAAKGQQGGFTFQQFARRHDANKDGKITRDEFKGYPQFFKRCDRNGDGIITKAEFTAVIGSGKSQKSGGGDWRIALKKDSSPAPDGKRKTNAKGPRNRRRAGGDSRNLSNAIFVRPDKDKAKLPPNTRYETCYSKLMNADIGYALYVPDEYKDNGKPFPILFFFHGKTGNEIGASRNSTYLHQAIKEKVIRPSLAVYVNGLHTSFYVDSYDKKYMVESFVIKELIPHLEKKYNIIRSREGRMLEGFSMGGHATMKFALKYPDMFCSAAVYGPALLPLRSFKQIQPEEFRILFNNKDELYEKVCSYDILDGCAAKVLENKVRFKLFGGTEDPSNRAAVRFSAALEAKGIDNEYVKLEGVRHDMNKYTAALGTTAYKFHEESMKSAGIDGGAKGDKRKIASPATARRKRPNNQGKTEESRAGAGSLSPAGIYYTGNAGMLKPGHARYDKIPEIDLPYIAGISFRQAWRNLEPKEDQYDWTPLENAYKLAISRNKWLMITVTGGMGTPEWVYGKGARSVTFSSDEIGWMGRTGGKQYKMVVTWDDVYLKEFFDFLKVLGKKIEDWKYVYCIHMTGGGFISEMHLPKHLPETLKQWEEAGISNDVMFETWKKIFGAYDKYMPPHVGLSIALSPVLKKVTVEYEIRDWALKRYGNRVWFQRNVLKERTARMNGRYSQQIRDLSSKTTVGWQTAIAPGKDFGDYTVAYKHAVGTGACFVEAYSREFKEEAADALMELSRGLRDNYSKMKHRYLGLYK